MKDVWMGSLAAQDEYNPVEGAFQAGIRATPWFEEFTAKYGEPNLNDPNYDYRAAWAAGARPTVRDPNDQLLHWPSQFKGENHPNRYVGGVDTRTNAPTLANAFDVPLEQSTNVGWANRMGEILTTRPQYDESTIYKTASPLVNISEGDIGRATEAAMGVSGGGMKIEAPRGIKAFHSSPHDFDKFDLARIGTGEGAQAYGHGLYFAESPAVSGQGGQYWQQFAPRFEGVEGRAVKALEASKFDREAAINLLNKTIERQIGVGSPPEAGAIQRAQQAIDLLQSSKPVGPRTYEVNINADPAHMLDWDTRIGQQPKAIQDYFRKQIEQFGPEASMEAQYKIARSRARGGGVELSAGMNEAGIPGIKYLDEGSRSQTMMNVTNRSIATYTDQLATATGSERQALLDKIAQLKTYAAELEAKPTTSNYVVFDPNIIDIMKKYGLAGAAPVGMGALAAQNEYEGQY